MINYSKHPDEYLKRLMDGDKCLKRTLDLLREESRWIQGVEARDGEGNSCDPLSSEAECFCLSGAVYRASAGYGTLWFTMDLLDEEVASEYEDEVENFESDDEHDYYCTATFNDAGHRNHQEVVRVLKGAIARTEDAIAGHLNNIHDLGTSMDESDLNELREEYL